MQLIGEIAVGRLFDMLDKQVRLGVNNQLRLIQKTTHISVEYTTFVINLHF